MHPLLEEKNYLACDVEVAALNVLQDYMENNVNSLPEHFSCKKTTKKGGFLVFGKETVMKSKSLKPSGNSITLWISGQCWSSENHAWWSSPSKPLLKIQRPLTIDVPLYSSVADYSIVTPKSMQAWCLKTVHVHVNPSPPIPCCWLQAADWQQSGRANQETLLQTSSAEDSWYIQFHGLPL